jgi:Type I phosphodiesterase / nucleotide pyrophosphatase
VPQSDVARYGGVIPEIYQRLDRVLERLLRETSPETLVVIASDHGGEANCEEEYRWADIHTENFIEALKLKGLMTAFRVGRKVYLRLRSSATPIGSTAEIADFIRQAVLATSAHPIFEVEVTGEQEMTVETVYLKEELEGQSVRFPDGRLVPVEQVLRLTPRISGNHSMNGVLLLRGPGVKKDCEINGAGLLDVVPTTLALVGRAVGRDMDGRVLTDAIEPRYLETQPIKYIDSYDQLLGKLTSEVVEDSDVGMETVKKRLEDLGYIN